MRDPRLHLGFAPGSQGPHTTGVIVHGFHSQSEISIVWEGVPHEWKIPESQEVNTSPKMFLELKSFPHGM